MSQPNVLRSEKAWFPFETDDGTTIFVMLGVRVLFEDGVSAFWSKRFNTVSVKYPGGVKTYNSGTPVRDLANRVIMNDDRQNDGMPMKKFVESGDYSIMFVALVCQAIDKTLAE